ncbi:hypothetical protein CEXT_542531 [Caerostris extrusa]|uniref:Uncharacterized protein n=1 Tax=Caerostris extrusa TaxID=172846 RepID=A0AAV4RAJ1_CAEEX|nr:hypothetical protein CEXT_542531 [Caerostris extrusa]
MVATIPGQYAHHSRNLSNPLSFRKRVDCLTGERFSVNRIPIAEPTSPSLTGQLKLKELVSNIHRVPFSQIASALQPNSRIDHGLERVRL